VGIPFTQWHEILSQNTRDSKLSLGVNQKSLSHMVLKRYWDVTDTKTTGQIPEQTSGQNYYS